MKKLISVFLSLVLAVNTFGITVIAKSYSEGNWSNLVPDGSDAQQAEYISSLDQIIAKVYLKDIENNDSLSDIQKALIVHDRIIENCEYDTTYEKRTAVDTLIDGTSVCTGYSYAYKYILHKLGIRCTLESSDVMNHLWNVVIIDNKRYYVDLTYDDPLYDMEGRVDHSNFLITSERFCDTHCDSGYRYDPYSDSFYAYNADTEQYDILYDAELTLVTPTDNNWYEPNKGDYMELDFVHKQFVIFNPYTKTVKKTALDFDTTLNNAEYQDKYWTTSNAAFQIVGNDVFYIDTDNSKLMKLGSSTPIASLTNNWQISAQNYYPGNFSRLSTDGYNLYYSDLNKIYKYDLKNKTITTVYTLDSDYGQYDKIFGFRFNNCKFIIEATDDLNWNATTKHSIQKTVDVPHYYGEPGDIKWSSDTADHWHQCLICGYKTDVAEHDFGNTIHHDDDSHWYECSVCGVKKEIQEHIYTDSCDTTCDICDYVRTTAHTVGTQWINDSTKHWHICTVCSQKVHEANHVYDNSCDTTCNVCGYTRTITHSYSTVWSKDSTKHWHQCSVCGVKKDEALHIYDNSCDTTCSTCGYVRTITHSYKTDWSKDASYHWHECTVCANRTDLSPHTWDSGKITEYPTPDAPGTRLFTCTVCGQTKTQSVPFIGIGGNVVSFGDATEYVTLKLFKQGSTAPIQHLTVNGENASYMFMNVENGNYTVTVSKKNHVERTYTVTVSSSTVTLDVKIHLLGDINGDGTVSDTDYNLANNHVRQISLLKDYAFSCADINNSGYITTFDTMRINSHSKGKNSLWQ